MTTAAELISYGCRLLGRPYELGAAGPDRFDCSGLVQYVYHQYGFRLPRVTSQQCHTGVAVVRDRALLKLGDLVFSSWDGRPHSHVGLYAGKRRILVAPHTGDVVKLQALTDSYWDHVDVVRRIPGLSYAAAAPAGYPPWPGRILRLTSPAMRGTDVQTWRQRMRDRGWKLPVTDVYDARADSVCRQFQREKRLRWVDGRVGPETWGATWTAPIT